MKCRLQRSGQLSLRNWLLIFGMSLVSVISQHHVRLCPTAVSIERLENGIISINKHNGQTLLLHGVVISHPLSTICLNMSYFEYIALLGNGWTTIRQLQVNHKVRHISVTCTPSNMIQIRFRYHMALLKLAETIWWVRLITLITFDFLYLFSRANGFQIKMHSEWYLLTHIVMLPSTTVRVQPTGSVEECTNFWIFVGSCK